MNTLTHFFTGYLVARLGFKKKNDHFLCLFAAMTAILPDFDEFLHLIIPIESFEHAIFTHTIIGALLFTVIYVVIVWGIGHNFLKNIDVGIKLLLLVAITGMASHLFLDIFTYREDVYTSNAHLYFWPVWNYSFHLNRFFPESASSTIHDLRLLIEIIYSVVIGALILYQWAYKKENPFFMFFPDKWLNYVKDSALKEQSRKSGIYLLIFNLGILICMFISLFA